jgi:RecB family exonuclease
VVAKLQLIPYGPQAIDALRNAIGAAKAGDPLAPVTVAIPSNYAGLSLRRKLALENERGLVNVRFYVLARIAELLGAPLLAAQGRKPLTGPVRSEAIRAVLSEDPGDVFRDVFDHAATERSLDLTFQDLRHASATTLEAIAQRSARAAHVVRLYRAFRERGAAYYDEQELSEAASVAVAGQATALNDVGHVVLYLPRRISPSDETLLSALAEARGLSAIIGLTGDEVADASTKELVAGLSPLLGKPNEVVPDSAPAGNSVIAVTDAEEEVRTAVRLIMERLEQGTPLHRVAVLYPLTQPYALLAHEQFAAAGVPHNGPAVRTLAQTLSGRMLLGLLRLREQDFRRDALMDWLSAAPVLREESGPPAPAHRWDTVSRAAGVVRGRAQWRERLARHARALRDQHDYLEARDDTEAGRLERIRGDIDRIDALARFIDELTARVETHSLDTWAAFGAWAKELLARYLGGEGHRATWPDEEIQAHRTVEEALESLSALDDVRAVTNESTFRRALERELERPAARIGRFGTGVFIGRIGDAVGTDFDLAVFIGMAEGALPPRSRDDPLLPDSERLAGGQEVPLRARRQSDERRNYLAALASARERVLIHPRADLRGQRGKLPAPWLLETASRLEGRQVFSAELETLASSWYSTVASFQAALDSDREPASEQEYHLRSLLRWPYSAITEHYVPAATPPLREGLNAGRDRQSARLSRWDGLTGPVGDLAPASRVVSPTALQDWATCPLRFLLGRILYVAETSAPEDTLSISPIDRGNLLHEALERFIKEAPTRTSPDQPWSDAERSLLIAIGTELCERAEAAGLTGKAVLWKLDRARILRDLDGFLDADEHLRSKHKVVPSDVEMSFGMRGDRPVTVDIDGRSISFRGRIDRVDRSLDGSRLLVIDYKSGSQYGYGELDKDIVHRGRALQLPVYSLAAQGKYGDAEATALYWFVSRKQEYKTRGGPMGDAQIARFREVLAVINRGVERGIFPARPGTHSDRGWDNCTFCPYDRVCPTDRGRVWDRKRTADETAEYVSLAESDQ